MFFIYFFCSFNREIRIMYGKSAQQWTRETAHKQIWMHWSKTRSYETRARLRRLLPFRVYCGDKLKHNSSTNNSDEREGTKGTEATYDAYSK